MRPTAFVLAMAALALFALGGCVTSEKYRMAKDTTSAAVALNYSAGVAALELRLVAVTVPQGPGSWKQNALWDEYIVNLTNRSSAPLSAESVVLVDLLGVQQVPGTDPWALEKLSETNWEQYARVGRFVLGVGAAAGAMEVAAIGYGLSGGVAAGFFFLMPAVLVANVAVVAVMNLKNKDKVQQQFERLRLRLPLDLAAGAAVQGSLFFPMVPAPQRLVLRGKMGEAPLELVLDLEPLAGLHLDPAAK